MKYQANSSKHKKEKKEIPQQKNKISPKLDSTDEMLKKHSDTLLYVFTGLAFLMSMIFFNPDVSVGGDDSTYLENAYKFASGIAFPDWHGPFYPIFLSFFYVIFGFKIIMFKMISVLFFTFSVFFTYKIFAKKANTFTAVSLSLISVFSMMLLNYASTTYSEPMFMFMQSLLLYLYFEFSEKEESWRESLEYTKKIILAYSSLAVLAYLTFQVRSVAVALVPGIFILLLIEKKKKPAIVFFSATAVFHLLVSLYRKIVWNKASVSFMEQLDANFLVNPYKPQYGYETLGGFFKRFYDNCALYLSKHLMKLFGFMDYDARKYSYTLAVIIIIIFLAVGVYIFKKNRKLFVVFAYVIVMVGVTFFMVQKLWDQERLIMIYFPMIAGLVIYTLNQAFEYKDKIVSKIFVAVIFFLVARQTFAKGDFDLSNNFDTGSYTSYTDDWRNYMTASKWASENLPQGSVIACRKSQMSWMASQGNKNVKFYGIYKLYSSDPDSMQHYLLDSIKATHVIMANLRLNPYELNGKTITTIRYSLRNLTAKYPYSLKLVKQFGDKEPAYLFEFVDCKNVNLDNLLCCVLVSPENRFAWEQVGVLCITSKDYDKVIFYMEEAMKFVKDDSKLPYFEAIAYNYKGDKANALKKIEESIAINASDGEVFYNKAVVLYEMQRYQESIEALNKAAVLNYNQQTIESLLRAVKKHLN